VRVAHMKFKIPFLLLASLGLITLAIIQLIIILTPLRSTPKKSDVIIVLGAQLWGATPSPMLQYRLDKALELFNEGYGDKIIVSGAQGDDELITEALAMKIYLTQKGVPEDVIFEEDNSYSTYQNLYYSNKIMIDNGFKSAIIVTNNFHIHRSLMIANRLNMNVSGGPTKNYPNFALTVRYYLREVLAYIKDYVLVR